MTERLKDVPFVPALTGGLQSLLDAGHLAGYDFEVICDHPLNIVRVMHPDGAGFIFRTWPGFLTLQRRDDYVRLIDKPSQKLLLAGVGLPTPRLLACAAADDAVGVLESAPLTYPCVAKPCVGTYSRAVFTHIRTRHLLRIAVERIATAGHRVLVEQQIEGAHYRVLCVGGTFAGCVERRAPTVIGDGKRTITALVAQRNHEPGRDQLCESGLLHPILIDRAAEAYLRQQGYTTESVPGEGDTVAISRLVTGRAGADFIDAADRIHPETVRLCEAFARRHHLFIAGFDVITPTIDRSIREVGAINEVNVREVDATCIEQCNIGTRRPVSSYVWERLPFDRIAGPSCPIW